MADSRFPLQAVQDLARFREEEVGRMVALAAARLAEGRQKAEVLRGYRADYARQLIGDAGEGVEVGRMRDTLAFIARIDQALEQQAIEVERLHAHWQAMVAEWGERTRELKTYEVLEQRHLDRLALRERRLEQRGTDDWAMRRRDADG
ncbi:MAG: flagellar export protein FliJ [Burkholderiales bacterium]|jgi:flagellar FliJ protein|nr:flagellar export protein FliJ [Betaproteobacteria bacterium]